MMTMRMTMDQKEYDQLDNLMTNLILGLFMSMAKVFKEQSKGKWCLETAVPILIVRRCKGVISIAGRPLVLLLFCLVIWYGR